MLEWLKKILYEEEEDIVEESELETIDFSHVENEELSTIIEEQPAPVIEEVKVEEPVIVSETKNNFDIQITEKKAVEKEVARPVRTRPSVERKEKEIEVSAVISPIYGGPKTETVKPTSESTPKTVATKNKKDALGTVISPMYGQNELEEHQKEVEEKIELKKTTVFIEEEVDEVPLEELIYNEEETDDCVQFSLFGEETKSSEIIVEE